MKTTRKASRAGLEGDWVRGNKDWIADLGSRYSWDYLLEPSPKSSSNFGRSSGVEMMRVSRMPPSISVGRS